MVSGGMRRRNFVLAMAIAAVLQEFAVLLKQLRGKMTYGSAGAGSTTHLACSLLRTPGWA